MEHSLAITQNQHNHLLQHLITEDGNESVAIMLCHRAHGTNRTRLMLTEIIPIPAESCLNRTAVRVDWPVTEYLTPGKITEIDQEGLSIFTIHSHPLGHDEFSELDDDNDNNLFGSIGHWFDDGRPNGSAIMLPTGQIIARLVSADGKFILLDSVTVVGEDIKIWRPAAKEQKETGASLRVAQAFGKNTLRELKSLRVGVVGCSGTGSIIIELLARNCVGQLVIADPDHVETKNLNRIVNATEQDGLKNKPKVEVLKGAVLSMGTETQIETHQAATYNCQVIDSLISCDIIFGCVDSAEGRHHLERITSACYLPYFDLGVNFELSPDGDIANIIAVAHYMHPGNTSLMQRGAYTSQQLTAEGWRRTNPKHYERQIEDGYLPLIGEDQPAVISVNMQAACLAFNDFLARLHGFRLDPNDDFAIQKFHLTHGYYENEPAPMLEPDPLFSQYAGKGDASFLLQQLKNSSD